MTVTSVMEFLFLSDLSVTVTFGRLECLICFASFYDCNKGLPKVWSYAIYTFCIVFLIYICLLYGYFEYKCIW